MRKYVKQNWPALTALAVAVVFMALGVYRGEVETVLRKAVNICMECIGLG